MKRICIDYENNAQEWWDAAVANVASCPISCRPLVGRSSLDEVVVTDQDATAFTEWAAALPGWSDGPDYARHPVVLHDVEPAHDGLDLTPPCAR